jgi:hypothetical protein
MMTAIALFVRRRCVDVRRYDFNGHLVLGSTTAMSKVRFCREGTPIPKV